MNKYFSFRHSSIAYLIRGMIPLLLVLLFASCSASKKIPTKQEGSSFREQTAETLLNKLAENYFDAEWLELKAKMSFQDEEQTKNFTATIRLRKDSLIWMNVKRLSIEAYRILIDKDSVYIVNRLDKEYYVKGMDFIGQEFNLPANFAALQTIILGNPYFFEQQKYTSAIQNNQYRLSGGEGTNMLSDYWLNASSFLLKQMAFLDLRKNRKMAVELEDYQLVKGQANFAFQRNFQLQSEKTGAVRVNIKFVKVEKDIPKSMPFFISSKYKRVDQ